MELLNISRLRNDLLYIEERVTKSDLIVVGKVTNVREFETEAHGPITFHHPKWTEAIISIESVEKGIFNEKSMGIFFADSTDIAWHQSPKFNVGHAGIWILRKTRLSSVQAEKFAAIHPMDFRPIEELDRIRNLIQKTRSKAT